MPKRLREKVAIITGAASGIGEATARLFAKEGAKVVMADINEKRLSEISAEINAAGGESVFCRCDVSDEADVKACVALAERRYGGRIDCVINAAGVVDYHKPVTKCSTEHWRRIMSINMDSVFYFCREALPYMERQGSGSIVNISSGAYLRANSGAAYTAAKFAIVGLSRNIAIQYTGTGIRCNVVCPGITETAINEPENLKKFDKEFGDKCNKHIENDLPMVKAIDQAYAILSFCTDEYRAVTGQVIGVDNGAFL